MSANTDSRWGISLKLYIESSLLLQEDTRQMKLYFGKCSGQIEFENILF
jgi:hypothetical protein